METNKKISQTNETKVAQQRSRKFFADLQHHLQTNSDAALACFAESQVVAVVFNLAKEFHLHARAAGWDGESAAFPLSEEILRRLEKADHVTKRWIRQPKPSVARFYVMSGLGSLLINVWFDAVTERVRMEIEPGSLDAQVLS